MASRWPHLGTAVVGVWLLASGSALAQSPHHEREGGLVPPTTQAPPTVVQVVAKEPLDDEEEILVEVIKAMPRPKSEAKAQEEEKKENFKVIKVKKELSEEPLVFLPPHKQTLTPAPMRGKTQAKPAQPPAELFAEEAPAKTAAPASAIPIALDDRPGRMFKSPFRSKVEETGHSATESAPASIANASGALATTSDAVTKPSDVVTNLDAAATAPSPECCTSFALPALSFSNVGWIDPALIGTQARVRYDSRFTNRVIDRAEFFTARNKQYFVGPDLFGGRGYPIPESNVDMQEATLYLEYAFTNRFSVFAELPARFMSPEENERDQGIGDFNFGFKLAYFALPDHVQTFQFRIYTPTGSASKGLSTGHASLEPALLLWQKLSPAWTLESEIRDWIPLGGSNYAGNTLRYALGLSCELYRDDVWSLRPVTELIGWSVLRGQESRFIDSLPTFISVHDASGTILESAWGVRGSYSSNCDWYLGYSFNLTNKAWFEDNIRLEMRWHY